jgi:anti-sigma factor RsiW
MQNGNHPTNDLLNEYLDREGVYTTPGFPRQELDEHLQSCPECRSRAVELRALSRMLAEIPEEPLHHDLRVGVLNRLATPRASERVNWRSLGLVFGIQLLAGVVLLLFAWPSLEFQMDDWILQELRSFYAAALTLLSQGLTTGGLAAQEMLSGWLEDGLVAWNEFSSLLAKTQMSFMELSILLAVAAICWLAVNGLLLGHPHSENNQVQIRRRNRWKS